MISSSTKRAVTNGSRGTRLGLGRFVKSRSLTNVVRIILSTSALVAITVVTQRTAQGEPGFLQATKGKTQQVRELSELPGAFSAPRVRSVGQMQAALTFDDGPCAERTRRTVEVLGDVVATFFVIGGQVRKSPAEAQYAASRGHSIQNHTQDHKRLRGLTSTEIVYQIELASDFIENTIGIRPTAFRPPYGSTSAFVSQTAASIGYRQILWNGGAPQMNSKRAEIINGVTNQANQAIRKKLGLVLLFHDCSGNFNGMITALPDVIQLLRNKGFQFVAIE